MLAPITIKYNDPTVLIVVQTASFKRLNYNCPLKKIKTKTNITPTAALSVAVKKPK